MTGPQFRAARALIGQSTRQVATALDCSAMAVSKLEREEITSNARLWFAAKRYYETKGVAFYAGGVICNSGITIADMLEPLRERFRRGKHGSAYALAFDRVVEMAVAPPQALPLPGDETPLSECRNPDCPIGCPESHCAPYENL